ncbi:hypothetical protein NOE16_07480 [Escherichia coli]|jgi:hypothetical protein|uniref:hypothetical protein n=1 Tax=Escherichia coli TaxID=562 RepID=UPI001FCF097C|nr:hypothetical protein [Escherichia coli]MCQ1611146.1 hypothetical protein [Escherichia coli]
MIDKYRLEDIRRESGENGELARWVIQLQADLDREIRKSTNERAMLSRLAMIMHGSETDLNLLTVTAQSLMDRCKAGNSPVISDGWVMVPKRLTAENGAKGVLSDEFSEMKFINCPECFGDDECETCDGSGRIEITVPVTWTTIKAIWAKGVEHFAAAPQHEVK